MRIAWRAALAIAAIGAAALVLTRIGVGGASHTREVTPRWDLEVDETQEAGA